MTSIHDDPKYTSSSIYHLSLGKGLGSRSQSKYDVKGLFSVARSNENFYAATDIVKVRADKVVPIQPRQSQAGHTAQCPHCPRDCSRRGGSSTSPWAASPA